MACPLDHKVTLTGPDGNPVVYTFKNEAELKTWMDEGGFEMIKKELELRKKQAQEAGKVETEEEKPEAPKEEEKKERETTGVKKKVLLEERAERGLEDVVIEMKRSGGSIFDAAKNLVDENPVLPRTLAAEVAEKGRPLTPEEIEMLKYDRMKIHNAYDGLIAEADEAFEKKDTEKLKKIKLRQAVLEEAKANNEIALRNAGYEWAKAGKAMQTLINKDYDVLTIKAKAKIAKGEELSEQENAKIEELTDKLKKAEDKLAAYEEAKLKEEQEKAFRKEEAKVKKEYAERKRERQLTKEELKAERASIFESMKKKLAEARKESKSTIIPYASEFAAIAPDLAKLAKNYMVEGVVNLDDLVDKLADDLKGVLGYDVDKRQIRDAVSGYGKPKTSKTKSEIDAEFKDIQTQMKLISAIEDAEAGITPAGYGEPKAPKKEPSEEIKNLKKKLGEVMDNAGISGEGKTPEEKYQTALKAYKTRLANRKAELESDIKAIEDGTYEPKPKKQKMVLDKDAMEMKAEVEALKKKVDGFLEEERRKSMGKLEKAAETFLLKYRRAALLSRVGTLFKLGTAATVRQIVTPVEQVIGAAAAKIPGIKKIAEKSPRYGTFSIAAEAAGASSFLDKKTRQEMWKNIKGEVDELDALYGDKPELKDRWEFFGQLHKALKTPARRAEFFRAYQYRAEQAIRMGLDHNDPVIQAEIGAKAYEDANRSIFMNKGGIPEDISNFIRKYQRSEEGHRKALGYIMSNLLPIVRVPYNYVAETTSYIPGLGATRAAITLGQKAMQGGIEKLEPHQADMIMRTIQKQAFGLAFMMLGYYLRDSIGGYYVAGEKSDEKDVKPGHIKFMGYDLPKWMLHTPPFEMLHFGATIGRGIDKQREKEKKQKRFPKKKTKKEEDDEVVNAWKGAVKGTIGHLPFIETPQRVMEATGPGDAGSKWLKGYVKSYVPGGLQELAEYTDQKGKFKMFGGKARPVKTETIGEELMSGVPGLRGMLKTDKEKDKKKKK
jgi:hypothetical protein